MIDTNVATPEITITLDNNGVVQQTKSSDAFADERLEQWRGRQWGETLDPAVSAEVAQMIEDVRRSGATSCFHVKQRFPSGRELQMEYTTVSLGKRSGFVAIGRNVQTISELQSRLLQTQQAREQDYWKIREIETRYRLLFDATNEVVLLVRASNLRIVEANLAATKALGLLPGGEFYPDLQPRDRKSFQSMLDNVREHGRAPGIVLHLGPVNAAWSLRASLMNSDTGAFYLFQIAQIGSASSSQEQKAPFSVDELIQRLPDGFVVVDPAGVIQRANHTFLDLAQVGAETAIVGQNLKRWLSRPGADITVLLAFVQRHGSVRMLSTIVYGELGSNTEVEISAVGIRDVNPEYVGLVLRDVTRRLSGGAFDGPASASIGADDAGVLSLEELVRASTEAIERRSIAAALRHSEGNRTLAAKRLGLSRQSLHTKLNKYNFG